MEDEFDKAFDETRETSTKPTESKEVDETAVETEEVVELEEVDGAAPEEDSRNTLADEPQGVISKEEQRLKSWEGRLKKREEDLKVKDSEQPSTENISTDDDFYDKPTETVRTIIRDELGGDDLRNQVQSIAELQQQMATEQHLGKVREAHNDVNKIVKSGDLRRWIEKQPSYIAEAASNVVQAGTTQQVIELLDTYKAANQTTQHNQRREKQSQDAEAVRSSGPGIPKAQAAADDFDGAFDEAVNQT